MTEQIIGGTDRRTRRVAISPQQIARKERRQKLLIGSTSLGAVALLYTVVSNLPSANAVLTPPPQLIFSTFLEKLSDGTLLAATWASLQRVLIGYLIGTSLAILLGTLMGWFKYVEYVFDPIVECLRPIPPLAYIPLVILWFGIGEFSRIFIIVAASFLTCIVNAYSGMKQVPKVYVEAAQTLGASPLTVFRTVALPYSIPFIFAGMRVAMAASWTTLVAAELVAAQSGLGFMLQSGRRFFDTSLVMTGIVMIGILAFSMDRIFRSVQQRIGQWSEVQ